MVRYIPAVDRQQTLSDKTSSGRASSSRLAPRDVVEEEQFTTDDLCLSIGARGQLQACDPGPRQPAGTLRLMTSG